MCVMAAHEAREEPAGEVTHGACPRRTGRDLPFLFRAGSRPFSDPIQIDVWFWNDIGHTHFLE